MKIPQSVRRIYEEQRERNLRLKQEVDDTLKQNKKDAWFYSSRIKDLESFALKLETGRVPDPTQLEDFFGCLIVVENITSIKDAIFLVEKYFQIEYRRPEQDNLTIKKSHEFLFDDLRLYARLKENEALPPKLYDSVIFEIQIKTFLQHAWSIAVHDLIYKADSIDWAKERIAYQIKAMLEHAEISIMEVETLCQNTTLAKSHDEIQRIAQIIEFLKNTWEDEDLPSDLVRVAKNIRLLCEKLEMKFERLVEIVRQETDLGRGAKTRNLSPYASIIQSIQNQEPDKIKKFVTGKNKKFAIVFPAEINMPSEIKKQSLNNAFFISPTQSEANDLSF